MSPIDQRAEKGRQLGRGGDVELPWIETTTGVPEKSIDTQNARVTTAPSGGSRQHATGAHSWRRVVVCLHRHGALRSSRRSCKVPKWCRLDLGRRTWARTPCRGSDIAAGELTRRAVECTVRQAALTSGQLAPCCSAVPLRTSLASWHPSGSSPRPGSRLGRIPESRVSPVRSPGPRRHSGTSGRAQARGGRECPDRGTRSPGKVANGSPKRRTTCRVARLHAECGASVSTPGSSSSSCPGPVIFSPLVPVCATKGLE